jgi:hypothetical protein
MHTISKLGRVSAFPLEASFEIAQRDAVTIPKFAREFTQVILSMCADLEGTRSARMKIRCRTGLAKTVLFIEQNDNQSEFSSNIKITVP